MKKMIADVRAFHEKFGSPIGDTANPQILNGEFRAKFLIEETKETADALIAEDPIEIIDGICDTIYVAIGAGIEFGIDLSGLYFVHTDKPRPTMRLIDNRLQWAIDFRSSGDRAATAIRCGMIEAVLSELQSVIHVANMAARSWGLDVRPFWDEVQRSNMAKVPSGSITVKTIKPPGWQGPRMAPILLKQYGLERCADALRVAS